MTTEQLRVDTNISGELWQSWSETEKRNWKKRVEELEEEWKNWLFTEEEVEKNPKREQCFELAWNEGHSNGYEEVENYFRKVVELIK